MEQQKNELLSERFVRLVKAAETMTQEQVDAVAYVTYGSTGRTKEEIVEQLTEMVEYHRNRERIGL